MKSQERYFKKTLKQHKHLKDIISIKKNEMQHLSRSPRTQPQPGTRFVNKILYFYPCPILIMLIIIKKLFFFLYCSKSDVMDLEIEYTTYLSHQYVLPVARGLVALILHNSANVDMFLLACKVRFTNFRNKLLTQS